MIKNKKFSNAINNIPQSTPPIWFMRQAGRYHSHYQSLRKKYSFVELCKTPNLAAEVAMGPINDFDYDVAILFSDILFPLESLGLKLDYAPGPVFDRFLEEDDIIKTPNELDVIHRYNFQAEALRLTRASLSEEKSLVGFVGGPWTLLSYGLGIKDEEKIVNVDENLFFEKALYDVLIPMLRSIIKMQLDNNAEIVYLFDTNAKQLEQNYFTDKYIVELKHNIFSEFPNKIAYFCKNNPILEKSNTNVDLKLSGMVYGKNEGLENLLPQVKTGFIQGNFDPSLLLKPEDQFKIELDKFIQKFSRLSFEERSGWICSLSHGVLPKAKENNVKYFINKVRSIFDSLD
jgi:uroporphyrinogen decarboxylase